MKMQPTKRSIMGVTLLGLLTSLIAVAWVRYVAPEGERAFAAAGGDAVTIWNANAGIAATEACLAPLDNLELFSQAPALTLESYAAIGRNAARHAKGQPPAPVPVRVDNMARLRLIVPTLLMHKAELACVERDAPARVDSERVEGGQEFVGGAADVVVGCRDLDVLFVTNLDRAELT